MLKQVQQKSTFLHKNQEGILVSIHNMLFMEN